MNTRRAALGLLALLAAGCAAPRDGAPAPHAPVAAPASAAPAPAAAPAPTPAAAFPSEEILAIIRERWVLRDPVDWPAAERRYREAMAAAADDAARAAVVVALLASQDDVHTQLFWAGRSFSHYHGLDDAERARLLPLLERERAQGGRSSGALLPDSVGYVRVPTMAVRGEGPVEAAARDLHAQVTRLAAAGARAWIVDLRLNGGGNLMPMLLGMRPLLGTGIVAGSADAPGRLVHSWVLRADGLWWLDGTGERRMAAFADAGEPSAAAAPVAVLLGPMTRSSGQGLALAFVGRANCVLLGEPTALGYTTGTEPFALPGGGTLTLATGYMTDRAGVPCRDRVDPQVLVPGGDDFDDLARDAKVAAARERLRAMGMGAGAAAAPAAPPTPAAPPSPAPAR